MPSDGLGGVAEGGAGGLGARLGEVLVDDADADVVAPVCKIGLVLGFFWEGGESRVAGFFGSVPGLAAAAGARQTLDAIDSHRVELLVDLVEVLVVHDELPHDGAVRQREELGALGFLIFFRGGSGGGGGGGVECGASRKRGLGLCPETSATLTIWSICGVCRGCCGGAM